MNILNKENFANEVLENDNDLNIVKVDIDESVELAIKYQVEVVPTLVIFKNGNPVKTLEGFRSEKELLEEINKLK